MYYSYIKTKHSVAKFKARYDRMGRDFDTQGEEVTEDLGVKKTMEEQISEEKHREIYRVDSNTVSFANMRPTDVKSCPRVILPKPRTV